MATQRFARIDVDYCHKKTCQTLLRELGPWGPLLFIALILRAKDGVEPGVFAYSSDALGWEKLGFDPVGCPVTLDEFFAVTGRLKQTSRTRVGRGWNVRITRYGLWQKESARYEASAKKARSRAQSTGDTQVTSPGTIEGQEGGPSSTSITTTTPHPHEGRAGSRANGTSPRQRGTSPRQKKPDDWKPGDPHRDPREDWPHPCPYPPCGVRRQTQRAIDEHVLTVHDHLLTPDDRQRLEQATT